MVFIRKECLGKSADGNRIGPMESFDDFEFLLTHAIIGIDSNLWVLECYSSNQQQICILEINKLNSSEMHPSLCIHSTTSLKFLTKDVI